MPTREKPVAGKQVSDGQKQKRDGCEALLSVEGSLASRDAKGGTAPARVAEQREAVREASRAARAWARVRPRIA